MNTRNAIISILLVSTILTSCSKLNVGTYESNNDEKILNSSVNDINITEDIVIKQPEEEIVENQENINITDSDITAVVEKYLWHEDGINVTIYPESNIDINGKTYYFVNVVDGYKPAVPLYVDVENELLFNGFDDLDISSPLHFVTIGDLEESGVDIVEEQSFQLPYKESVRFVSGLNNKDSITKVQFYLTNENNLVIYEFPMHYVNRFGCVYEVVAVSFKDVDEDNDKDIIVICSAMTGVGKQGAIPFNKVDIYLQQEDETYITNVELSAELCENIDVLNISNVMEYLKSKK